MTVFTYTGLSKRNGAKLRELSYNFPKLADMAVHGRPHRVAAVGAGIFKQGTFLLHHPVQLEAIYFLPYPRNLQ